MDKITKALLKLSEPEKQAVKKLLIKLKSEDFSDLDLKKLKGFNDIYRVRKGKMRIIYRQDDSGAVFILKLERRNDNTYNF